MVYLLVEDIVCGNPNAEEYRFRVYLFCTVGVLGLLASLLLILILDPNVVSNGTAFFKVLGVLAILDIAGTLITLLMWRLALAGRALKS